MEEAWFYFEAGERRGPVTIEELVGALLSAPNPREVLVWREGMADWQPSGTVPEVQRKLPSAMPPAPPPPMPPAVPRAVPPSPSVPRVASPQPASAPVAPAFYKTAENVAKLYRRLVVLIGIQLLLGAFRMPLAVTMEPSGAAIALLLLLAVVYLVVLVMIISTTYRLAGQLGEGVPALWAAAMFLPCINIIMLLVLSSRAQTWCRRHGIKVGLLGPTRESIEELKRRGDTSHFD
jgi:GYF domain 2